jgi:hypothetical protein
MKLHHIGLSTQSEPRTAQTQTATDHNIWPSLRVTLKDPLMQNATLSRKPVLRPHLLDVDERPLPLAELHVLQARKRQ